MTKHQKNMKHVSYTALFEKDKKTGDICVSVPELPGCFSWGKNMSDAQKNICEALELYVATVFERDGVLPVAKKFIQKKNGIYKLISVKIAFEVASNIKKKIAYV